MREPGIRASGLPPLSPLRCLEEAIVNFAGSVLVVSHDRWFLDRVATHILAFEGDSKVSILHSIFSGVDPHLTSAGRHLMHASHRFNHSAHR